MSGTLVIPIYQRIAALDDRISSVAHSRDLVLGKLNAFKRYEAAAESFLVDGLLEQLTDYDETLDGLTRQRDELLEAVWVD